VADRRRHESVPTCPSLVLRRLVLRRSRRKDAAPAGHRAGPRQPLRQPNNTTSRVTRQIAVAQLDGHNERSPAWDRAVSDHVLWPAVIAIVSLLGTAGITPALGRGGHQGASLAGLPATVSAHVSRTPIRSHAGTPRFAGHNAFQSDRFGRRVALQNRESLLIWPYSSTDGVTPIEVPVAGSEVSSDPQVIIIPGPASSAPEQTTPEAPTDYSYVPGCHAIPNGYHCDASQ
jgi:hypothetical protein